ncbi:helix-turn-helix domain-containing protein [Myroides sp. TSA_177.3]|uniref:helix-turn-helix domain-containing protein n=1 Tax=Myroides sp. TSA_177.3 TaxID=3415650 RepID=UPI004045BF17
MKNTGEKIKKLRITRGYSQEELAMQSGLSIRTIQRIEKGETIPRGNSLQLLCEVLGLKVEELFQSGERQAEDSTMAAARTIYFLVLTGIVVPFGNILGPLIGWSMYKKNDDVINTLGKNVIFIQIAYTVLVGGLSLYAIFNKLGGEGYAFEAIMVFVFILGFVNYGGMLYIGIKGRKL